MEYRRDSAVVREEIARSLNERAAALEAAQAAVRRPGSTLEEYRAAMHEAEEAQRRVNYREGMLVELRAREVGSAKG